MTDRIVFDPNEPDPTDADDPRAPPKVVPLKEGARRAKQAPAVAPMAPAHDLDVEAVVLSGVLLRPDVLPDVAAIITESAFYSDANRWIWRAMGAVFAARRTVDVTLVAAWLKEHERLSAIGGSPYLATILDATPAVANVLEHARVLRDHARRRLAKARLENALAKVRVDGSALDVDALVNDLRETVEGLGVEAEQPKLPALPGSWLAGLGDLATAPPKRPWLLSDVRLKRPLLRMGKCAVLAADGGVGKSFFWLQLAVCIATGRDLFDIFRPEQPGHVALLMGEDDAEECMDRLFRICNAMALSSAERKQVASRIFLSALAGHEVSFLEVDPSGNPRRTEVLEAIVTRLAVEAETGGFGWSFVGVDPLARFASGNAESDNALATAFVQSVESIAMRVPGGPAVGVTHHSSKLSVRAGAADVRGVTGIRNGFRAAFTMTKASTPEVRGVLLENPKNNLAPEADPLWLVRLQNEALAGGGWLETGGVLRRATDDEADALDASVGTREGATAEQRARTREAKKLETATADVEAVLAALPDAPSHTTISGIVAALRGSGRHFHEKKVRAVLDQLASTEGGRRAVDLSGGSQGQPRQWARAREART